jgi:hypothetical protein
MAFAIALCASHPLSPPTFSHPLLLTLYRFFACGCPAGPGLPAAIRSSVALRHGDATMEAVAAGLAGKTHCMRLSCHHDIVVIYLLDATHVFNTPLPLVYTLIFDPAPSTSTFLSTGSLYV